MRGRHCYGDRRLKKGYGLMKKAVMLINDTTYAFNLRSAIIEKLISEDFEVVVAVSC